MAQAEAKYRSLMETAADGILLVDCQGKILEANAAAAGLSGYEPEQLIGRRLAELLPQDSTQWLRQQAARADKLNQLRGLEGTAQRHDGTEFPFEASVNKLRVDEEDIYQIVVRDLTQRNKLQQQLLQGERLRALGQIASGVAHDFNNLLGAILGRTQLLLMKLRDPDAQRALQTIEKAALDGADTVKRIQRFAQSNEGEEKFVPVALNSLVDDVIETTRYRWDDQAQCEGITIQMRRDLSPVPTIMANPAELRQLLTNLTINACEAMPSGGTIAISTRADAAVVTVAVSDTGVGMAPDVQQRTFERFFTTKEGNNSGLGLSLARDIARRHGGDLVIGDSSVNQGTTFILTLPRSDEPIPTIGETTMPERSGQAQVLVVDDEPVLCELLVEMLETLGHQAVGATSSEEAFRLLNVDNYDVVITDLGMPNISGWKIAEAAKQDHPDTYVILLTGWDNPLSGQPGRQVDRVLSKPVTITDMARAVSMGMSNNQRGKTNSDGYG